MNNSNNGSAVLTKLPTGGSERSLAEWAADWIYMAQGVLMVLGNALLMLAILGAKKLRRRHELLMIAGLAFADLIYGLGAISKATMNLRKALWSLPKPSPTTPLHCALSLKNLCFTFGPSAGSAMMVAVSMDRLLAVRFFSLYMSLTYRYARNFIIVIYTIFLGWTILAVVVAAGFEGPVPGSCPSKKFRPQWFDNVRMVIIIAGGVGSVVIFGLTWAFFKAHKTRVHPDKKKENSQTLKRQRKMTMVVGITVLVTLLAHTIPTIINTGLKQTDWPIAEVIKPWLWILVRVNSLTNFIIFTITIRDIRMALQSVLMCQKYETFVRTTMAGSGAAESRKDKSVIKEEEH